MYKKQSLTLWVLLITLTVGFSQARKIEFTDEGTIENPQNKLEF